MAGEMLYAPPLLTGQGRDAQLNIAAATVVKSGPGRVARVSVITAGSAAGTVNDCATTGAAATANQIATIPNAVGHYTIDFPFNAGLVVVPGTGQVLAVSFT